MEVAGGVLRWQVARRGEVNIKKTAVNIELI